MFNKKGQTTLEFFIIYTFLILIITGMFLSLNVMVQEKKEKLLQNEVSQVGIMIKTYLDLMEVSPEGFKTEVELPLTLLSGDYSIRTYSIEGTTEVLIEAGNTKYIVFKEISSLGSLKKGSNTLWKYNNKIYINDPCWETSQVPCGLYPSPQ